VKTGASGGNDSIGGTEQRAGIRTLDPYTNKTTTLLNNYFGWYFNTVDDLFVDAHGDVWFTDPGTAPSSLFPPPP
jgi:sugar lactone lactonase YvrE